MWEYIGQENSLYNEAYINLGAKLNILRLQPFHAAAYRALMLEAFATHPDAYTSSALERAAQPLVWWEGRLQEKPDASEVVFGAIGANELRGVVGVSFASREKVRHKAKVFGMYVSKGSRGDGLATSLLQSALEEARTRAGVTIAQLTVTKGNISAEQLYTRAGFVSFGVEPCAVKVSDGYITKLHMWKRL